MQKLQQLRTLLEELDNQLTGCMRCGMCQSVCPVYAESGNEAHVARGKFVMLEGLAQAMIDDAKSVQERLEMCLLCGRCAANCPSGVKGLEIFFKARAALAAYLGLSTAEKAIFRGLLTRPKLMNKLMDLAAPLQKLALKPDEGAQGASCARFAAPLLRGRRVAPLAETPLHKIMPSQFTRTGASGKTAAFFPGCVVDKIFPNVGEAALKVFDRLGVGVRMPEGQLCCGIPALSSGDVEAFTAMVRGNLALFKPDTFDVLLTPCATCTSTISHLWPMMAEKFSPREKAQTYALAAKAMDISQFLVAEGLVRTQTPGTAYATPVTYHDPCHLRQSLGVIEEPRTMLKANPHVKFVEMQGAEQCCGCGGSFNLKHYDESKTIGERKRDNIASSGAKTVATSCPACMLQMTDMLAQHGDNVRVRHVVEVFAETLE